MPVEFYQDGQLKEATGQTEIELQKLFVGSHQTIGLEWINGQYWLRSDIPKERPIGIEIDKELDRHLEYFRRSSLQKELLAKAIGVKGPKRPRVVDLTAGLLGDSLLFLSFGCQVAAVERHPIISFLIQSSIANARHPLIQKLSFYPMDSIDFLQQGGSWDVLYYDPMFEDPNEKASPRKEMRIFRSMVGKDQDAEDVFKKSLEVVTSRLVIKRPKQSVPVGLEAPLSFVGKATRYDVYFGQNSRSFEVNPVK